VPRCGCFAWRGMMWLKPGEGKAGNPFELTTRCIHDER
jgi:hypothetical protein